jgi:deoxyribodipyrimidine photo-lyase
LYFNMNNKEISIFWFRRDFRLLDNHALSLAMKSGLPVLPLFIFDVNIIDTLKSDDPRISFIYEYLENINNDLKKYGSSLKVLKGEPIKIFKDLTEAYNIREVFANKDYEPYAIKRDNEIEQFLDEKGIGFIRTKDHVIFEENEIIKADGNPYTVFTPYKKKWLEKFSEKDIRECEYGNNFLQVDPDFPSLQQLGFKRSKIKVRDYDLSVLDFYAVNRDFPEHSTTHLGPHLRFGTVSIREIIRKLANQHEVFLSELIWREFFMQILYHFPSVEKECFRTKYNNLDWRNNEYEFELWKQGRTGYPLVDSGMRELNETGNMHNRVRMVVASFLVKHLLIDWRWGEAYFAEKLLDYELSSNNGNWQWAAGTGCDAAPYFRIFNPETQLKKFDKDFKYVKKWLPELGSEDYPKPIVDHKFARQRALDVYGKVR